MTRRTLHMLLVSVIVALRAPAVHAQGCDGKTEHRLDQESYLGLSDRVYVYAPDIGSLGNSGGWQPFNLRILVAEYRQPFLLRRASLREGDLKSLLASRPDLKETPLPLRGSNSKGSDKATLESAQTSVKDGERSVTITVRVTRVVPVSGGTDHLFLVCRAGP